MLPLLLLQYIALPIKTRDEGAQTGVVLKNSERIFTTKHISKVKVTIFNSRLRRRNKGVKDDYADLALSKKKKKKKNAVMIYL